MKKEEGFGVIQDFLEDAGSSTGYAITLLVNGEFVRYDCAKEVFDVQFDPRYIFPLINETPHRLAFDENGVVTRLIKGVAGENIRASYGFGTPKAIGHVMKVEGHKLVFKAKEFNEEMNNGHTVYYTTYHRGKAVPVGQRDLELELDDALTVYCLDWTKNEKKHSLKSLGFLADVLNNKKNCYWISVYDLYGDNGKFDCVCMFLHHKKDPESVGGDLDKDTRTREERLLAAQS